MYKLNLLILIVTSTLTFGVLAYGESEKGESNKTPELDKEHFQEELGVNQFTTPSIKNIFTELDIIGQPVKEVAYLELPTNISPERSIVALSLGTLIADGFLAVQKNDYQQIERIGKSILTYSESLGAKERVSKHAKALLKTSLSSDWNTLREHLASTQKDVEDEMIKLRDVEMVHLISLGGWVRALNIVTSIETSDKVTSADEIKKRTHLVNYYYSGLKTFHPRVQQKPIIQSLLIEVEKLHSLFNSIEEETVTTNQTASIKSQAKKLFDLIDNATALKN